MVLSEKYENVPKCEACQLLGQASLENGNDLILVTLSPNPEWNGFADLYPHQQYSLLQSMHIRPKINSEIFRYYENDLKYLSSHYEFNKSGQLHSHCLFSIPKYRCTPANLQTISKIYHKVIGRQYCRSTICCDVRRVTDEDIYKYLNKENVYPSIHKTNITYYKPLYDFRDSERYLEDTDSESDTSYDSFIEK